MFETPELSSDLEWMLESGQASQAMLAEALVQEYACPVYRLGLALLGEPAVALAVTRAAFTAALLDVYHYRSAYGVASWLYANVLSTLRDERRRRGLRDLLQDALPRVGRGMEPWVSRSPAEVDERLWRGLDGLGETARLGVLLHYVAGLEVTDIARLVEGQASQVQGYLATARRQALEAVGRAAGGAADLPLEELDALVERSLGMRWPAPDVTGEDLHALAIEVEQLAGRQGVRRRSFTSVKEVLVMGLVILAVMGTFFGLNGLLPEGEQAASPVQTVIVTRFITREPVDIVLPTGMPAPTPTPPPPQARTHYPHYVVQSNDTPDTIYGWTGYTLEELYAYNRIPKGEDISIGQVLYLPSRLVQDDDHARDLAGAPTPVVPASPPPPLTEASNAEEILARIQGSYGNWNTLWVDLHYLRYGPPGYVGPPQAQRVQAWVSDSQFLFLSGNFNEQPQVIWLGDRWLISHWQTQVDESGNRQSTWAELNPADYAENPFMNNLGLLFPTSAEPVDQALQVTGSEPVAGRPAVVVDSISAQGNRSARWWVDQQTGLLLRIQHFTDDGESLADEVVVQAIAYDVDFSNQILFSSRHPWRGGFAQDYTGAPASAGEPLSFSFTQTGVTGPAAEQPSLEPDFNPARSRLTFRYPNDFDPAAQAAEVELLADGFSLGKVTFGNPWTMLCERSPDGSIVAFIRQPSLSPPHDAFLRWFDLNDPTLEIHSPMGGIFISRLSLAPDNRRLAVFGNYITISALYGVDTLTGVPVRWLRLADARSLVWSPDSAYLALIGKATETAAEEVIVVRTSNGRVVYRNPYDPAGKQGLDALVFDWGVQFPQAAGGLGACSAPPER